MPYALGPLESLFLFFLGLVSAAGFFSSSSWFAPFLVKTFSLAAEFYGLLSSVIEVLLLLSLTGAAFGAFFAFFSTGAETGSASIG